MKKFLSLAAVAAGLLIPQLIHAAAYEQPVFIRGVRPLGMGGAFTAIADDQNAIFYNPAGITQRTGSQLTIFELPIAISEDVLKFYQYYQDNETKLKDFDTLSVEDKTTVINDINDKITKYKTRVRLGLPNTSFLSGPGFLSWGFGVFSQADLGFQFERSMIIPAISFWGSVDALGAVPLAHKFESVPFIPGSISVGTTLKMIDRARISENNKSILEFENFDPLLQWGQGFGMDVGTLYQPNNSWNVGLQITDIGGTPLRFAKVESTKSGSVKEESTSIIRPECTVGTAFIPARIYYWPGKSISTKDRLILACDVRDVFNEDEPLMEATFWKKVHLGAELRWFAFAFRLGANSGYPSMGVGLNLYLLQFEYAYWGDELGRYAGQIAEWNHQLAISMRFGQNKGRAWGRAAAASGRDEEAVQPVAEEPAPQVQEPAVTTAPLTQGTTEAVTAPVEPSTDQPVEKAVTEEPVTPQPAQDVPASPAQ